MFKQFFKDSLIYSSAVFLSRGVSLLLVPFYTRVLSPEDYGAIDLLYVFGSLISWFVTLGIAQGFGRFYPETAKGRERVLFASTLLWFSCVAYFIFIATGFVRSGFFTRMLLGSLKWQGAFRLAVMAIGLDGIFFMLQAQLRWRLQSKEYSIANLLQVAAATLSAIWLVLGLKIGISGIFIGQIIGSLMGILLSWYFGKEVYRLIFSWEKCKAMLSFSLPLVPSCISVVILNSFDYIAIKKIMTIGDVGLYGVGARFASIVVLLFAGINIALTPLIYKNYKRSSAPGDLARIFRYACFFSIVLITGLFLFDRQILILFTTPKFYPAYSVMPILAVSLLFLNIYRFAPGLEIAKKSKIITFIYIIFSITNIALNFLLIPFFGILGAACASLISSFCVFIVYLYFSQRLYYVPHRWSKIIASVCLGIVIILVDRYFLISSFLFSIEVFIKFILLTGTTLIVFSILLGRREFNIFKDKLFRKASLLNELVEGNA